MGERAAKLLNGATMRLQRAKSHDWDPEGGGVGGVCGHAVTMKECSLSNLLHLG